MTDNIVDLKNPDGLVIDVAFCDRVMPPLIIPVSARAKERLNLADDCDCALFYMDTAEEVLAMFGEGYVFTMDTEYVAKKIAVMTINMLH